MTDRLLELLRERANHRGLVMARADRLQQALRCSLGELERGITALSDAGKVEVLEPLPFLVLALKPRPWSGTKRGTVRIGPKTGPTEHRTHSYSFHNQSIDQSKAIAREDGGAGEGESLLQEILITLGESDPKSFRAVLEHYSTPTIRAVLNRVRATPREKLRKSRTALFRFLLSKTK